MGSVGAPPWVKRYWVLKVFRHWSIDIMETRMVVGFKRGNVICQKPVQVLTPSIFAASWILWGMDANPTRNMMVK